MTAILLTNPARASCFKEAAARYGVSEELLRAIAKVESGSAPSTVENRNANGTRDIGRMQINTVWLGTLASYGITEASLRDECISIQVGAWILSNNMAKHGQGWDAIGAYNVGCRSLPAAECKRRRNRYAWKVFHAYKPSGKYERALVVANESNLAAVEFTQ